VAKRRGGRRSPRAAAPVTGPKRPVAVEPTTTTKRPFIGARAIADSEQRLSWRFALADDGGPWSWRHCGPDDLREVFDKLGALEQFSWAQLPHNMHHAVTVDQLCPEAQGRLRELQQDDVAELYSIRLSGQRRVCGILHGHVFYLLWWDPNHEVCPALKRHT